MAGRDKREERRARASGNDEYVSSSKWLEDNKKGGGKLPFAPPDGLPVVKLEKDKVYRWSVLAFLTGKRNPNPSAPPGKLFWNRVYESHTRLGPNKESRLCLARNFKEACPCCDENERLYRMPQGEMTPADKELMKAMRSSKRIMMLVYDHDQPQKGVQFYEDSYASFGEAFAAKMRRYKGRPEYDLYDMHYHPQKGYVLHVGTTEKAIGSFQWIHVNDIEFHKRDKPLPLEVVNKAKEICLDDLIADNKPKASEIKKLIAPPESDEADDHDDEDEDREEEGDENLDTQDEVADDELEEESEEGDDLDEEFDDEEEEEDEPQIAVGDVVTFLRKGVRVKAKVIKIKGDKAQVKTQKGEELVKLLDDLTPLKKEKASEEDRPKKKPPVGEKKKSEDKPKKKPKPVVEEEEDEDGDEDGFGDFDDDNPF